MYESIVEIKKANRNRGDYFFSPATMEFFNSRVESPVYYGRYFITSELSPESSARRYTIRRADDSGVITTVGDFYSFASLKEAKKAVKKIKKGEGGRNEGKTIQ